MFQPAAFTVLGGGPASSEPDTTFRRQSDPRFKYIPDMLLGLWTTHPDEISPAYRRLFEEYVEIVRILHKSGVPLMTGTDCPVPGIYPGFAVHEDLALLVRAGLTPAEALRAATLNPALFLHRSDRLGSIFGRQTCLPRAAGWQSVGQYRQYDQDSSDNCGRPRIYSGYAGQRSPNLSSWGSYFQFWPMTIEAGQFKSSEFILIF